MTQFEQLEVLLNEQGGMIRTSEAVKRGVLKPVFYNYVKEKELEQAAHGIYVSPDTWVDAMYLIHLRCSHGIFSHETALFIHDLTDREPSPYSITVKRGYSTTRLKEDGVVTPLKIDISTGDAITPREVRYRFKLMLEERFIDIWAYNLETVLAEKPETIITRTTTNTRMRDFYDIYILEQLHGRSLNPDIFHNALLATAHRRDTERYLNDAKEVFCEVEDSKVMQNLWSVYRKKFSYAADLEWEAVMEAVRRLYALTENGGIK